MSTKKRKPVAKKAAPTTEQIKRDYGLRLARVERAMVTLIDCLEGKGTLQGAQLRNIKAILTEAVENDNG